MVMRSEALRQSVFIHKDECLHLPDGPEYGDATLCSRQAFEFEKNAQDIFAPGYKCTMELEHTAFYFSIIFETTCQGKYNEKYIEKLEKEMTKKWVGEIQCHVDSALAAFSVKNDES